MFPKHTAWGLMVASLFIVHSVLAATDKPADSTDKVDKHSVANTSTTSSTSNELGLPHNMVQMLANGGAIAVGVLVVAALIGLIMQVFGFKYCQLLGNCENTYAYSSSGTAYQNDPYGYSQPSYQSANTYQKRSIDYVGPVINMLRSAYEKYGQNSLSASSKKFS